MSKKLPVLFTCLLSLFVSCAAFATSEKIIDQDKGFSIELPKKWEVKRAIMGAEVVALRPLGSAKETFRENINVVIETLSNTMQPKDYFKASQSVLKKVFTEFKSEQSGHTTVDRHDFYWSIFSHKMGGIKTKVLQYMTVDGNKGYVITGSALPSTFVKYKKEFQTTATSFRILPKEVATKPPTTPSNHKMK